MNKVATLTVFRLNPETHSKPRYEDHAIEADQGLTVLDAIRKVRDEKDGSLSIRYSCRSAICGSCGVRVNGYSKLACKTLFLAEWEKYGKVVVEPLSNFRVIKDLVVDMEPFWEHMERIEPWLIKDPSKPVPEKEYLVSKEQVEAFMGTPNCISCGLCHAACPAVEVEPGFPGPASLAKLYRFVVDPRDDARKERLESIAGVGLWWCVRCYYCVEACPKEVRPGEVITYLRELVSKETSPGDIGTRHAKVFSDIIERRGELDETALAVRTLRSKMLKPHWFKFASLMGMHAKTPPLRGRVVEGVEQVKKIYEELSDKQ